MMIQDRPHQQMIAIRISEDVADLIQETGVAETRTEIGIASDQDPDLEADATGPDQDHETGIEIVGKTRIRKRRKRRKKRQRRIEKGRSVDYQP
nr:unnamed protein product [Callosobruchus analis]